MCIRLSCFNSWVLQSTQVSNIFDEKKQISFLFKVTILWQPSIRLGCDQLSGHAGQTGRSLSLAVTFSLLSSTALTFLSLSLHSLSLFLCWGPEGSRLAQQDSCRQTRLISTTAPVQSVSNSLSGELTRRAAGPAAILTH